MAKVPFNPNHIYQQLELKVEKVGKTRLSEAAAIAQQAADATIDKLFQAMAGRINEQKFPPSLIGTPYWPTDRPLSDKWVKRKKNNLFFRGLTGDLLSNLPSYQATELYGKTNVVKVRKKTGKGGYAVDHSDFALKLFPNLNLTATGDPIGAEKALSAEDSKKLIGRRNFQRLLLVHMIRWFIKRDVPKAVKAALAAKGFTS